MQTGTERGLQATRPLISIGRHQGHQVIDGNLFLGRTERNQAALSRQGALFFAHRRDEAPWGEQGMRALGRRELARARRMGPATPLFLFLLGEKGNGRAGQGGLPSWKKAIHGRRQARLMPFQ